MDAETEDLRREQERKRGERFRARCTRSWGYPWSSARTAPSKCPGARRGVWVVVNWRAHIHEPEDDEESLFEIVRTLHGVL
jgi:hypothetical protein